MPEIYVQRDNLDEANAAFAQAPLHRPVFLNSVPKSGSHLLRNILRMFVPVEQQYSADFIQWPNLRQHLAAFDPVSPMLSWGHLFFADGPAIATAEARRILLYRDPYDWVLARARFILSDQFEGDLDHLRSDKITTDELLTMMIFGLPRTLPSLNDIYELNAAAWLGTNCFVVTYEKLVHHLADLGHAEAKLFFSSLLDACGISLPDDWRERVRLGADRKESATARERLTGQIEDLPERLGDRHRALVDYQAPGLRAILGYE
ncbi:hypothetical protein [Novosphingopyxis iocasae]|uniref:hypothetical protein n=1 Tax=Novosphingopyxis iocasae TaxID=2762729 RepID=UPI0016518C5A|nr:hypothetical protein [Novosphingopyxis iocasae]